MRKLLSIVFTAVLLLIGSAQGTWARKAKVYDLGHYLGGTWAEPNDISNSGVVVGYGDIPSGYTRPIGVPLFGPNAGQWFDLGTLGGDRTDIEVMAMAIADNGMIVGHSAIAGGEPVHAFAWTSKSGMVDLGTLAELGHTWSLAYGTNKAGTLIAGYSGTGWFSGDALPVVWTPKVVSRPHGPTTTWSIQRLDTTGFESATYWCAVFVNNSGQIIGTAWDDSLGAQIAVVWNPLPGRGGWKIMQLPTSSDYPNAFPDDINDKGEIVGLVESPDGNTALPALWKPVGRLNRGYSLTVLPNLPGPLQGWGQARGINNLGDIVGYNYDADWNLWATRWSTKDPTFVQLLDFPGTGSLGAWSAAMMVNDSGIAAGAYGSDTVPENVFAAQIPH